MFDHPRLRVILGPPGTGKTTALLDVALRELEAGVAPDRIAFVSFTRRATEEARSRGVAALGKKPDELPWFRTLHSFCFRALGVKTDDLVQVPHMYKLMQKLGVPYHYDRYHNAPEDAPTPGASLGEKLIFIEGLARTRCVDAKEQWRLSADDSITWLEQDRFNRSYRKMREDDGLVDYTELLERVARGEGWLPKLEVVIVDEAQDLSQVQWRVLRRLAAEADRVYVAGDDDQAIYEWAGADVPEFLSIGGAREVLARSWRLPRSVHGLAARTAARIRRRFDKSFAPRDADGRVVDHVDLDSVPLDTGHWLVLSRNVLHLTHVEERCRQDGLLYEHLRSPKKYAEDVAAIYAWERLRKGGSVGHAQARLAYDRMTAGRGYKRGHKQLSQLDVAGEYTLADLRDRGGLLVSDVWHDALDRIPAQDREYFRAVLRRGEKLTAKPRIRLSTIHGAKGAEEERVCLLRDITPRSERALEHDPDGEARVAYVAVTRARDELHVVGSHTHRELPIG